MRLLAFVDRKRGRSSIPNNGPLFPAIFREHELGHAMLIRIQVTTPVLVLNSLSLFLIRVLVLNSTLQILRYFPVA
jgi:hypothetical protein